MTGMRASMLGGFLVAALGVGHAVWAQDTRSVSEPVVPPVCTRLEAKLFAKPDANGGKIADEDEGKLDSDRIQAAIDACGPGKAVELALTPGCKPGPKGTPPVCAAASPDLNAFLSGPLELRDGVTLLVDKGVTVYGSRDPKVYEITDPNASADAPPAPLKCGTSMPRPAAFPVQLAQDAKARRGGCRSLVSIVNAKNAAIMGEGTLDGRGYAKILGKTYSWWEQARAAQPKDDLYFNPRMITASKADGLILYKIHINNSPNFHVGVNGTNGFTAWGVHLQTPVNKALLGTPNDARNTDGIDPGFSENVTVTHSWIDNGDDNIAIKAGVSHMSVIDNHFYTGHGMSIGSETVPGQSFLLVDGLVEDHTTSGVRIKSNVKRGGAAHDLVYKNICMRDVPIPIAISPYYTNQTVEPFEDPNYEGDKIPDYKRITLENITSETAGDVLIAGLNEDHRTTITLKDVVVKNIKPSQVHLHYTDITQAGSGALFPLRGDSVKVLGEVTPGPARRDTCKFVPYE